MTGSHGLSGRAVYERLHGRPGWEVIGASRRAEPPVKGAPHVAVNLADAVATRDALARCAPTHLFFGAYLADHDLAREAEMNRAILVHTLDALAAANAPLRHVVIFHGGKAYGAHLGPFTTPAKESDPPVPGPLLYHDQEQVLREYRERLGFTWTVLRPDCICGPAVGSPINLLLGIAVLATLARERGEPLHFPGTPASASSLIQATDARLLGRASEWAATAPGARNEIFNVTNGDVFRWENMWPLIGDAFGVPMGDVIPVRLADVMLRRKREWEALVARHGLVPTPLPTLVDWRFVDAMLGMPYDLITSTIKIRQAGFGDCIDSGAMFVQLFDDLRRRRYIPAR
ncbi:MAG TPA: SDR family oxidoreductase [Streptosporangiaceae bacterium]|nr:SDR family oxidoreductase [Streptosporangiaceae bacterium]